MVDCASKLSRLGIVRKTLRSFRFDFCVLKTVSNNKIEPRGIGGSDQLSFTVYAFGHDGRIQGLELEIWSEGSKR